MRAAIKISMPPTWPVFLPNVNERIDQLSDDDLRMLLVLTQCYWCLGRIQGIQDMQNGEKDNG